MNQESQIWQATSPFWRLLSELNALPRWPSALSLKTKLLAHFDALEENLSALNVSYEAQQDIKYALAALFDEHILNSDYQEKDHWLENTLQWQLFEDNCAGLGFFKRLTRLQSHPKVNYAVLMIYYLCLQMGFKGRYAIDSSEQLSVLQHTLYELIQLQDANSKPVALAPLLKQPQKMAFNWRKPAVLGLCMSGGIVCLLYLIFQFKMSHVLDDSLSHLTEYKSFVQAQVFQIDAQNKG
jgi:type VI secretion system protein ImpK